MTKPKHSVGISRRVYSPVRKQRTRLGDRRHNARIHVVGVLGILTVFLGVLAVIFLWQSAVRVVHIRITNNNTSLVAVVKNSISGVHFFIPDNSIFFLSENRIRQAVLQADPAIAAVSISRTGFDSLSITPDMRAPLARWCGTSTNSMPHDTLTLDVSKSVSGCYFFDGTGFLYKPSSSFSTSSLPVSISMTNQPLVTYRIYASLTKGASANASSSPLLSTVSSINKLPALFDFAREIGSFGSPVISIVLRGDEVDLFLKDTTRITYVLGQEQSSFALLSATKNKISISNGSLLYVDLRFPGKVYYLPQKS